MPVRIYNSLTGKKEDFVPLTPGKVSMYVCGPTVYDESHIGHLRAACVFDFIRRYLRFRGFKVTFVRNITDIDDKIISRAREEHVKMGRPGTQLDLRETVRTVAEEFTRRYEEDMESFGIEKPDIQPKATEHIDAMIALIGRLIAKGAAYPAGGDVYFRVRSFSAYGRLSRQSIDEMVAGSRGSGEKNKKDPLDFALWKKAGPDEPWWDSPWGKGRPGWHIECSVMSTKYLGETFDIHGGGRDLIFPHHENEIAQSEAAAGKPFARYWIHNGLLTVENEKMSKSLGNFITVKDILARTNPDALKILFLSAHYAHPVDYSESRLREAEKARERFTVFFRRAAEFLASSREAEDKQPPAGSAPEFRALRVLEDDFLNAMDDDFNTAEALAALFEIVTAANQLLAAENIDARKKRALVTEAGDKLKTLGGVLGLFAQTEREKIPNEQILLAALTAMVRGYTAQDRNIAGICPNEPKNMAQAMESIIAIRSFYKKAKNFTLADTIRGRLNALGIILEDKKDSTTWRMRG